ncbi:MAG: hypothetical protein LBI67_00775 [Treponema sp.]|jgi:xylulokinase|nr:hypothetical protein [Treponema sp.]
MFFCGLDVGTSGVKAVVFDEKGSETGGAYRAYSIQVARDGTRLLRGQEIWDKTKEVLAQAAAKTTGKIEAVCASSFGEAFVALDAQDSIICDPMLFTDRWGEKEYLEAEQKTNAEEIARICGLPLSPSYSLSKILYLQKELPGVYGKTKKILLMQDFITFMLCGETAVDYASASRTMFFDARECVWSAGLMAKFGLDKRHYYTPVPIGTLLGTLRKNLAGELGIGENVKVVAGGHDQPVNAIGSGLQKGCAVNSMGTAECITPIIGAMLPADFIAEKGIPSEPFLEKGSFSCLAYNQTSGLLVQWFLALFAGGKELPYDLFNSNVPPVPTKIMVQPYLMGSGTPYMDSGARLAVTGVDYGVTKFDLYRALLEGLCLDQRLNISVLKEQNVFVDRLIAVGGGSKSRPWLEIKADILQIPVSVLLVKEAGALGCAILSAVAAGVYRTVEEAARNMSHIKETIPPNPVHAGFYREKFDMYRELHSHVKKESAFAVDGAKV